MISLGDAAPLARVVALAVAAARIVVDHGPGADRHVESLAGLEHGLELRRTCHTRVLNQRLAGQLAVPPLHRDHTAHDRRVALDGADAVVVVARRHVAELRVIKHDRLPDPVLGRGRQDVGRYELGRLALADVPREVTDTGHDRNADPTFARRRGAQVDGAADRDRGHPQLVGPTRTRQSKLVSHERNRRTARCCVLAL